MIRTAKEIIRKMLAMYVNAESIKNKYFTILTIITSTFSLIMSILALSLTTKAYLHAHDLCTWSSYYYNKRFWKYIYIEISALWTSAFCFTLCCAMLCYVMLGYALLWQAMLFYVRLCYVMLCYAMIWYVRLCCFMSGYAMLC